MKEGGKTEGTEKEKTKMETKSNAVFGTKRWNDADKTQTSCAK